MTPEQRETLKLMVERGGTQCGRMCGDYEPHEMDALRAALAPAPTCGTCHHVKVSPPMCGLPALYMCGNKDAPAHAASCVSPDDGCIKGYAPTEPTR